MVLIERNSDADETMPQTVPSAGFTPPCDYTSFADNFDLSLLPGGDQPVSPSTLFYTHFDIEKPAQPKLFATFYPTSPSDVYPTSPQEAYSSPPQEAESDIELAPDFQTLLVPEGNKTYPNIYLEVPSPNSTAAGALSPFSPQSQGLLSPNENFTSYRQSEGSFYPSSPEQSLYTASPSSVYSTSPRGDENQTQYIKTEESPLPTFAPFKIKEEGFHLSKSPCSYSPEHLCLSIDDTDVLTLLEGVGAQKQIKEEAVEGFGQSYKETETLRQLLEKDLKKCDDAGKPKDHKLLREVLKDTSFQRKFNIKPIDFGFLGGDIKMEEPDDLLRSCNEEIAKASIEPVLNMAIEQMRKDVDNTCTTLGISADPSQWDSASVLSWIRWTSRQFSLPEPMPEQWDMPGSALVALPEEDFTSRAPQGGMILHAQLEIWKAAYSDEDLRMQWRPETASSNASSGDMSDEEEEETPPPTADPAAKPTTSRSGSHIHLWQFLKELLASPQTHGSCIRWLDRTKGIFKIEDSVKVARLWGKRKKQACDELRQAQQVHQTVLQEGHHEENREVAEARLPVLLPL
nr:DNA-binding protein D-ETS-4 isoform X1 [Leptinotarsa decemlineata]